MTTEGLRGITVSIGYAETLRVTLVHNMRHLAECLVVTSPEDRETQEVIRSVPGARLHVTDAATRHGARFNKGLCMEEGFDVLGREGLICVFDADILFPDALSLDRLRPGFLHGARRRILDDPARWRPDLDWSRLPLHPDDGPIGFAQIFSADDPYLAGTRPWYDVSFAHAGGGDAYFMRHWPRPRWSILPIECLHLGRVDTNWFGTDAEGREIMAAFVHRNGWRSIAGGHDPGAADRVGTIADRVTVPGYEPSTFDLPGRLSPRHRRRSGPH
jgi:hypothetical protein